MDQLEALAREPDGHGKGNGNGRLIADRPDPTTLKDASRGRPKDPTLPSATVVQCAGSLALVIWFVVFVVGLLVSSSDYRDALLPPLSRPTPPDLAALGHFPSLAAIIVFAKAALTFSPINIGLLCVTAGLVGGCAANLSWYKIESLDATAAVPARRSAYLTEHPANAVMRSFLIYLLLMAGLLAFMPDPFKLLQSADITTADHAAFLRELAIQQGSYTRLAALASVLAFMVGYDPSRFDGLFELVPRIGNGSTATGPSGKPGEPKVEGQH